MPATSYVEFDEEYKHVTSALFWICSTGEPGGPEYSEAIAVRFTVQDAVQPCVMIMNAEQAERFIEGLQEKIAETRQAAERNYANAQAPVQAPEDDGL
jgi:hypothetical protein